MNIYRNLNEIANMSPTAVALGNFDGVHKGHQMLIRECVAVAKEKGLQLRFMKDHSAHRRIRFNVIRRAVL